MRGARAFTAAVGVTAMTTGLAITGTAGMAGAAPRPKSVALPGSVAPFTAGAKPTGSAPGAQRLTIQLWLRPRTAAAERYAMAASTPGSALFHHYLSPDAWAARFGASPAAAGKVAAWLRGAGFTAVHAGGHRSYVRATGAISQISAAFRTRVRLYGSAPGVNAGPYRLRANDRPVSVPASIAASVLGVTGIDNAAPALPLIRPDRAQRLSPAAAPAAGRQIACSHFYGEHIVTGLPRQFGRTSFPSRNCGYSGQQLRAVYGMNSVNTGKGQTVALVELGLTRDMFLTLQDYAKANRLPAPSAKRYSELSLQPRSCTFDQFNIEEQLDVEATYAMAPGASELVIGGDSCNRGDEGLQGLFDADVAVLGNGSQPLATIASNSWEGLGTESQPPSLTSIEHAFLVRAAAEGVGMYFGSGDGAGVHAPSSDPLATAVGGTTLGIGKAGNRLFETGWSNGMAVLQGRKWISQGGQGASGGGTSLLWREPDYQLGVVPAALSQAAGDRGTARAVPDISAVADPFTGFAYGFLKFPKNKPPQFQQSHLGGTSLSTPLVAGIVAAAQQGQAKPFGLINPLLYKLAGTSAITDTLPLTSASPSLWRGMLCGLPMCGMTTLATFDDQSPAIPGYAGQVTLKGYDNMTGVGTPNGQKFITALRKLGS
jgi:subtilase family serine protease